MSKIVGGVCTGGNFAVRRTILDTIGWFNTDILFYGDESDFLKRAEKHTKMQYMLNLKMPTSSRRYTHQGTFTTWFMYLSHMFKPSNAPVKDFR
jgi:GT2 family glycosyltransferase